MGEKDKKEKDKDKEKDKKEKKEKEKEKDKAVAKPALNPPANPAQDLRKLFKEGQKNLTPPVADATRAFYESLYAENPESVIAIKFCVEYGILPLESHKKVLKKYNNLKD